MPTAGTAARNAEGGNQKWIVLKKALHTVEPASISAIATELASVTANAMFATITTAKTTLNTKPKEEIKMERKKFDVSELYALCNKEQLFTCGSVEQYKKMFEIAREGVTQLELAYILYVCSSQRLDTIFGIIEPLFNNQEDL